ncbi:MAG: gluconokinase [Planctomycetota bacterium]
MAERPRVIVVMGVSGSGKTTVGQALAERIGAEFQDADDHHPQSNIAKMRRGEPLTDADRGPWLAHLRELIQQTLDDAKGKPLVLTCSALKRSYRDVLTRTSEPIAFVFLNGDRQTLTKRLSARGSHFFDPKLLDSQLATLERPNASEALQVSIEQPADQLVETIAQDLGLKP